MESLQRKVNFLGKVVMWIGIFAVNSAVCLPGVIISIQYRNDSCVTNTNTYNVLLDWWLFAGSMFQYSTILMMLPCVCLVLSGRTYRIFQVITNGLVAVWIGLGIFLVAKSDLHTCQHDSLWIMSLVFITVYGLWTLFLVLWLVLKNVECDCCGLLRNQQPNYHEIWTGQVEHIPLPNHLDGCDLPV